MFADLSTSYASSNDVVKFLTIFDLYASSNDVVVLFPQSDDTTDMPTIVVDVVISH
jgi:hypothetical protein